MSGTKTEFNNQWGRTADDGAEPTPANITPAPGDNRGKEPLVDLFGRLYVVLAAQNGGGGITVGNVVPIPGATASGVDSLQSSKFVGPGIPALLVAAGPGKFYLATGYNPTNGDAFLMVFANAIAGLPVDGDIPELMVKLGTDNMEPSSPEINLMDLGVRFPDNLKAAISTTPNVLTLPVVADEYWIHVLFYNQ